mgnify:CR=1 FL=1
MSNDLTNYTASLYKSVDNAGNGTDEFKDGDVVSLEDNFYYCINKSDINQDIQEDMTYTITLPESLYVYETKTDEKIRFENDVIYETENIHISCDIGSYSMQKGENTISITFKMDNVEVSENNSDLTAADITFDWISEFNLAIGCMLNENEIDADDNGQIEITLPQNKILKLIVSEFEPEEPEEPIAPTLTKKVTSAMNNIGIASWKIVYTAPNDAYIQKGMDIPKTLKDTIPEGLKFSGDINISLEKDGQIIEDTVTISDESSFDYDIDTNIQKITITYNTQLKDEEFYDIWQGNRKKYENKAVALDAYGTEISSLTAKASVNTNSISNLLRKEAHDITYHKANGNISDYYTVDWTVYVNTSDKELTNLTFVDTYADGLFVSEKMLESEENFNNFNLKIEYDTDSSSAPTIEMKKEDVSLEKIGNSATGKEKYKIRIKLDDYISGNKIDTTKPFKITYSMQVDEEFINSVDPNITAEIFKNTVYGEFKTEYLENTRTTPSVSDTPPYSVDALVSVKGLGYDNKTRKLEWSVIINPPKSTGEQPNLTKIVFQDDVSNNKGLSSNRRDYQSFGWTEKMLEEQKENIKSQIEKQFEEKGLNDATVNISFEPKGDRMYLNVIMEGTGKEQIDFKYYTYSMDARYWGGNLTTTHYNEVALLEDTEVDGKEINYKISATAKNGMGEKNNTLSKSLQSYDTDTGLLTWNITVNNRCAPLGQTRIVETLSDGLVFNSCLVDGKEIPIYNEKTDTETGDYVIYENGISVIYIENVYEQHNVQVITKVDVNSDVFKNEKEVELSNKASLQIFSDVDNNSWIETADSTANTKIKNNILNKTSILPDKNSTKVDYTVEINPLKIDLLDDEQLHLYIQDTLDDGLVLDDESVKLYEANVKIDKVNSIYTPTLEISGEAIENTNTIFNSGTNTLSVELPQSDKSYILKYSAYITIKNVELNDNIKLIGSSIPQSSSQYEFNCAVKLQSYSSATLRPPTNIFYSVVVNKTDDEDKPLKGVTIAMYSDKDESCLLGVGVSDENGKCIISVKNYLVKDYDKLYIKEITAPEGYLLNQEWFEFNKSDGNKDDAVVTIENKKAESGKEGKFVVYKYDEDTKIPLEGAEFALFDSNDDTKEPIKTGITNVRGLLTFDGLEENKEYFLKEITAPKGYLIIDEYKEPKSIGKAIKEGREIQVANSIKPVTFTVIKQGSNNQILLSGAEFELYDNQEFLGTPLDKAVTDTNGEAKFTVMDITKNYWLKETKAPIGYKVNYEPILVDFEKMDNFKIIVINQKKSSGGTGGGTGEIPEEPKEPQNPEEGKESNLKHILKYVSNGGTVYDDEFYSPNKTVSINKVPYKAGYIFTGWYADEELTKVITDVYMNEDKIVYAGWKKYIPTELLNTEDHFAYIMDILMER